ncbi:MAG: hypothetical protein FJ395_08285 [Verrucomicrobia bacterium]|nr:hypothetical protein [Verrucomicrobiota bacterium]
MKANRISVVMFAITLLFVHLVFAQQEGMVKVQKPLSDVEPGEWWRTSWQAGYQYYHAAEFELVCETKFVPGDTPRWIDQVAAKHLLAGASLRLGGIAHINSFALEGSPNPLLARYYESVHVDRKLSGKFQYLTNTTQGMHQWLFSGGIKEIARQAVNWIGSIVSSYVLKKPIPPKVVDATGAGTYLGKKAQEGTEQYLRGQGLSIEKDGFQIKTDSQVFAKLPFAVELKGVDNLAVQMTEDFRNRFLVMQTQGNQLKVHDGTESAEKLAAVMDKPGEAKKLIASLPEPSSERVGAVLQRETLALNKAIFDGRTRRVGDVWTIDGSVLSGFLHPDLKGNFQGRVVLKYEKDDPTRKSEHYKDGGATYTAQVLHIVPSAQIKREAVHSNLEYVEPKFRAKINDQTEATIYVDAKTAMVREAILDFQTDASREVLPDMVITSGLQAAGKVRLTIHYLATRSEIPKSRP